MQDALAADIDDRHHALGRPKAPNLRRFRNYYALAADCAQARRMGQSSAWKQTGLINRGADAVFAVTPEGEAEMWAALKAAERSSGLRAFRVTYCRDIEVVVTAKSRSAARYRAFLEADCSETFSEFLRRFSLRVALA
jgi:hypothetical protein